MTWLKVLLSHMETDFVSTTQVLGTVSNDPWGASLTTPSGVLRLVPRKLFDPVLLRNCLR